MNDLDVIRAFADPKTLQKEPTGGSSLQNVEYYLPALSSLAKTSEWLKDQALVDRVVSRLEALDAQSPEARAQTAAVYMKLISQDGQQKTKRLNTTRIKISDQESIDLPKKMLMAESSVLQRQLSANSTQSIDLSGKASKESLAHLAAHLATGKTDFVTDANAVELLLLAKEYELRELAMKCLEQYLNANSRGIVQANKQRQMSPEESCLECLLLEARSRDISISRSTAGVPYVKMRDGSSEAEWDCLTKLHDLFPVTHLQLTQTKHLGRLLAFSRHNPGLVSLDLDDSPNVTDQYLEELSPNLLKLTSFSIRMSPITAIPQAICDQVIELSCNRCEALQGIKAARAEKIYCGACMDLKSVSAPCATTLKCCNCYRLASIDCPGAKEIECKSCLSLRRLNAPRVVTLDCRSCSDLRELSAPELVTLYSSKCRSLESIDAPRVETLDCVDCNMLTSIHAPAAVIITCSTCTKLKSLSVASAIKLDCNSCRALTSINAPCVVTLDCSYCRSLTSVYSPSVESLECANCDALDRAAKFKLWPIVTRNIILANYRDLNNLADEISALSHYGRSMWGLDATMQFPLKQWFKDVKEMVVPPDFDSESEKAECDKKISALLERLMSYAARQDTLKGLNFTWFSDLKQLNSPQQRMIRVVWLGAVLACIHPGENPLEDPQALQTVMAIGNLGDPFLQEGATRALFSMYDREATDRKEAWISLKENRSDHMLVLCLLLARAKIGADTANQLVDGLSARYYRDFKVFNSILEATYLLSQEPYLTTSEREKMMRLILQAPEKGPREGAKQYAQRIRTFRIEQSKWVNACRDLLLFDRGAELRAVQNVDSLLDKHKKVCQTIFGVKDELLYSFLESFKSKRYPNGLFTYAARLQTLPDSEKAQLTELLGDFVNGHLEGAFPASRYDVSNNAHLERIFSGNEQLLKKWKEPLEIGLEQKEAASQDQGVSPSENVRGLMAQAVRNKHLGVNQETFYPALVAALTANEQNDIPEVISALEKRHRALQDKLKATPSKNQDSLKDESHCLEVEILALRALNPQAEQAVRVGSLKALLQKLPDGVEFKNDVRGVLKALEPSKSSKAKWVKLQTTVAWEDLLLMGTEVNNSCQRIDGDACFNKCLLAYILDGKNLPMIVRDAEGRIAARSVLRILWDDKQSRPVLFMESIYTTTTDPALPRLVMEGCVEKAKRMGLPLVASPTSFPEGPHYKAPLLSLGGPAPFEYVDALHGIQVNGEFTIPTSNIVYMPDAEPSSAMLGRVRGLQA